METFPISVGHVLAMRLAQALRDDVVGAQRDALLVDLHLQMDSASSCAVPEDSGSL